MNTVTQGTIKSTFLNDTPWHSCTAYNEVSVYHSEHILLIENNIINNSIHNVQPI